MMKTDNNQTQAGGMTGNVSQKNDQAPGNGGKEYWTDDGYEVLVRENHLKTIPGIEIQESKYGSVVVTFPTDEFLWLDGTATSGRNVVTGEREAGDILRLGTYISHHIIVENQTVRDVEGNEIQYIDGETIDTGDLATTIDELKGWGWSE